jgi:hypothetical protein
MIGDSILTIDDTRDISINGRHFKGTRGLWELLTRKYGTRGFVTADDLKRYKTISQLTNAHLQGYEPGGNVQTSRGPKFREVISKLFPQTSFQFYFISNILQSKLLMFTTQVTAASDFREIKCTTLKNC